MERTERQFSELSRVISHALRHEPWRYELELDADGWVGLPQLLESLRTERADWSALSEADLKEMLRRSSKQRHEIENGQIRATYGHSVPGRLARTRSQPPNVLYHGTNPELIDAIRTDGLRPMQRQNIHLSVDTVSALEVGRRKSREPVLLLVRAIEAHHSGIAFYEGNEKVWLADRVPWSFIQVETAGKQSRPKHDGRNPAEPQ